MTLTMELGERSYDIIVARGVLKEAGTLLNLNRKCLIVTDAGVPQQYAETVAAQCKDPTIVTVGIGEGSKSFPVFEMLCKKMLELDFHRSDCVVAVGGGVVGDLAGFAAASFMRGIDFYNLPTTVLSQVDSSIGGKVAINLEHVKNIVGAFWQPKRVLIDPDTLSTLEPRQISNGLAEAIKMACTSDKELFEFLEQNDPIEHIEEVIIGSLKIKKAVVEQDETEQGLRKLLNFGHTIGHGIESTGRLLHGECVGLGMLPMCSEEVRNRLLPVLEKAGLPTAVAFDRDQVWEAMQHDKKFFSGMADIITVDEIGKGKIQRVTIEALKTRFDREYRRHHVEYGLIGEHLPHSFSKEIHEQLADYTYELHEVAREDLDAFMRAKDFKAINVTIPYKQDVIPYLDEISESAREIGAVNTIVNRDGKLFGDNTDHIGMTKLIKKLGLHLRGRTVLILGTGGTSRTAQYVAKTLGARVVHTVSRDRKDGSLTYENAKELCPQAQIILNTTPAGMYPNIDGQAISLYPFQKLEGVVDVVYNPLRTPLVQEAQIALGLPAEGGLYMLVGQAVAAVEIFLDQKLPKDALDRVFHSILLEKKNIVLTGMPGAGKSTVGAILAEQMGRPLIETDLEIQKKTGLHPSEIINTQGEAAFREIEAEVIAEASVKNGVVISTGGGAVLRAENIRHLKGNGKVYFLDRPVKDIKPTGDRPLSANRAALENIYHQRYDIYLGTADLRIPVFGSAESVAGIIRKDFES